MLDIKEKVIDLIRNKSTSLPTLPVVINNIIVTARDDNTTAKDLAGFISNDQSLSARVLKIANSPYYGQPKKIDSITRAIIVIGFKEIISIALGSGIFKALSRKNDNALIDINELWKHSIGVSFAAKHIEKKTKMAVSESSMLVGLLHDIGKILFIIYFPDEYRTVLEEHQLEGHDALHKIEKKMLGIDHSEMAYLIMKQWSFPDTISLPVLFHHNIAKCPFESLNMAMMANTANYICHKAEIGFSGDLKILKQEEIINGLGLSRENINMFIERLRTDRSQVDSVLNALS
jgi:putative nucleotidyltransferase with HDIG domain